MSFLCNENCVMMKKSAINLLEMVARCGNGGEGKEIRARVEAGKFAAFRIPAKSNIAKRSVEEDLGVGFSAPVGGTNGAESHRFNGPASSR